MKIQNRTRTHTQLQGVTAFNHHAPMRPTIYATATGRYVTPGWVRNAGVNQVQGLDELYYSPIYVARECTFDQVMIDVRVAAAGAVARLGLYSAQFEDNGRLTPNALTSDWGTVSVASTGLKTIVIDETLAEGFHFLASSSDGTPQYRGTSLTNAASGPVTGSGGDASDVMNKVILSVTVADGAAALPDPATVADNGHTINLLSIVLRTQA